MIYTYYDNTNTMYPVDQDTATLTFTALPDTINIASISSLNPTVGAKSNYSLSYTLKNHLPINSYIIIGLPIDLTFDNILSISASLSINGAASTTIIPTFISTSTTNYSTALNFSGISSTLLPSGTVLNFTFGLIINPSSTKPTGSLSIFTYKSPQFLI
jgi:hypothetical protein